VRRAPALLAGREHVALHRRLDNETGVRMARRYALGNLLLIAGSQRAGGHMALSSDRDLSPRCAAAEKQIGELGEALGLVVWVGLYRHNRQRTTRLASPMAPGPALQTSCKRFGPPLQTSCKGTTAERGEARPTSPPVFPGSYAHVRWLSPDTNQSGRTVQVGLLMRVFGDLRSSCGLGSRAIPRGRRLQRDWDRRLWSSAASANAAIH
jgi:hypothetical protein